MASCYDCISFSRCKEMYEVFGVYIDLENSAVCKHFKNKADVLPIEEVADVMAQFIGFAPCEMVGNEWLFDCCEEFGNCYLTSDAECWLQYLKYRNNRKAKDCHKSESEVET